MISDTLRQVENVQQKKESDRKQVLRGRLDGLDRSVEDEGADDFESLLFKEIVKIRLMLEDLSGVSK